jgi:hypothetical protein
MSHLPGGWKFNYSNYTCDKYNGTGTITTYENLTCPECQGTGHIINIVNALFFAGGLLRLLLLAAPRNFYIQKKQT